jgi:hypothetical protein
VRRNAYLIGVRSKRLGGAFIRWWTGQDIDHIALINLDGRQIYEISYLGQIRVHEFLKYTRKATIEIIYEVPLDFELCSRWMIRHKDDDYDWIRTLSWPIRKWWKGDNPRATNCVEFGEGLCNEHGFTITDGFNIEAREFTRRLKSRGTAVKIKAQVKP